MSTRLRRNLDFPSGRFDVFDKRNRLANLLDGEWHAFGYTVRYQRTRVKKLYGDKYDVVSRREIVARIFSGNNIVGAVKLIEWHCELFAEHDEFLECMDGLSKEAVDFADMLCCNWSIQELFEIGPVIEFNLAWLRPDQKRRGLIWSVAESCIKLLNDNYSLMILKAFPLEFEGNGEGNEVRMAARLRAMKRLYSRVLGMGAVPNIWGQEGWMWKGSIDPMSHANAESELGE